MAKEKRILENIYFNQYEFKWDENNKTWLIFDQDKTPIKNLISYLKDKLSLEVERIFLDYKVKIKCWDLSNIYKNLEKSLINNNPVFLRAWLDKWVLETDSIIFCPLFDTFRKTSHEKDSSSASHKIVNKWVDNFFQLPPKK